MVEAKATLTIGTFESPPGDELGLPPIVDTSVALPPTTTALAFAPTAEIAAITGDIAFSSVEPAVAPPSALASWVEEAPASMRAPVRRVPDDWENAGELVSVLDPPTAWKELLPSKVPARRKPRPAPINKRAMAAGIAIALGVPALGLYWSSDLPPAPEEGPQVQPSSAATEVQEAAVQNSTLEAFTRDERSPRSAGTIPTAAPRAPDPHREQPRAAAADAARETRPAPVSREAPPVRPVSKANAPQDRRASHPSKPPVEGLPINPY